MTCTEKSVCPGGVGKAPLHALHRQPIGKGKEGNCARRSDRLQELAGRAVDGGALIGSLLPFLPSLGFWRLAELHESDATPLLNIHPHGIRQPKHCHETSPERAAQSDML